MLDNIKKKIIFSIVYYDESLIINKITNENLKKEAYSSLDYCESQFITSSDDEVIMMLSEKIKEVINSYKETINYGQIKNYSNNDQYLDFNELDEINNRLLEIKKLSFMNEVLTRINGKYNFTREDFRNIYKIFISMKIKVSNSKSKNKVRK